MEYRLFVRLFVRLIVLSSTEQNTYFFLHFGGRFVTAKQSHFFFSLVKIKIHDCLDEIMNRIDETC